MVVRFHKRHFKYAHYNQTTVRLVLASVPLTHSAHTTRHLPTLYFGLFIYIFLPSSLHSLCLSSWSLSSIFVSFSLFISVPTFPVFFLFLRAHALSVCMPLSLSLSPSRHKILHPGLLYFHSHLLPLLINGSTGMEVGKILYRKH